jgi:hypothetical protein
MQIDTEAAVYLDLVSGRNMFQQEANNDSKDWFDVCEKYNLRYLSRC